MSLHMRGFIEDIYKGENMYKQKKNEKSTKNNRKRSRNLICGIGILTVIGCLSGCKKEEHRIEEVRLEEAGKSDSDSKESEDEKEKSVQEAPREPKTIWVYVSGAVRAPGVYELPEGSRLFEVLERAGGMTEAADQTFLNQAELLADGIQIQVWTKEEVASGIVEKETANASGASGGSGNTSAGKVNLNTATKEELMTLPGIGEAKADSILTYRESAGSFQSIEQIKEIEGIKDGVFEKIKELITV